jgi:riboflavin synthase
MFTGITTDLATVATVTRAVSGASDRRYRISTAYDLATAPDGASIACNGCCLTVVGKGRDWFEVDVSGETLARTTLGEWTEGTRVNLERPMKIGDELGGHIVQGHVDDVATITGVQPEGGSKRITVTVGAAWRRFIASKGSVALDGVSLTVNEVIDLRDGAVSFEVNIIPHTQAVTTFGLRRPGDRLNMEIDIMARYVARHLTQDAASSAAIR